MYNFSYKSLQREPKMIAEQLINILNDKLKNPIYKTIQLINIKDILDKSNFTKKEGVAIHLVVIHFVYMLVMNKKIAIL